MTKAEIMERINIIEFRKKAIIDFLSGKQDLYWTIDELAKEFEFAGVRGIIVENCTDEEKALEKPQTPFIYFDATVEIDEYLDRVRSIPFYKLNPYYLASPSKKKWLGR